MLETLKADVNAWGLYFGDVAKHGDFSVSLFFIKYLITSKGFREVCLYRIGHSVRNIWPLRYFFLVLQSWFSAVEIQFRAEISGGIVIPHPFDIVIEQTCRIGDNVYIYQGVTIGADLNDNKAWPNRRAAIIGDNAVICAGAKIIGPINIGDDVIIGANSVVLTDVPNDSTAVGVPSRIIPK